MNTNLKLCLSALTLAFVSTPAVAEQVTVSVEHADLNLSNEKGIETLKGRLNGAINRVCGPVGFRSVTQIYRARKCRRTLRRQARMLLSEIRGGNVAIASNFEIEYRG